MDNNHDHEDEDQHARPSHVRDLRRGRVVIPSRSQIDWARKQKNLDRTPRTQQKVVKPHDWNRSQQNWDGTQTNLSRRRRDTEVKMPDRVPPVYFVTIAVIGGIFGALRGLNYGVWPFNGGWLGGVTGALAGVVMGLLGGSVIILVIQEVVANMSTNRKRR
jgi:hypothetical protein